MAISSYPTASSVTELSLSPCYHYQYSSIGKSINGLSSDSSALTSAYSRLLGHYFPSTKAPFWLLNTDSSPLVRSYSPCLENRGYVYCASKGVGKNRPIAIGYEFSTVGLNVSNKSLYASSPPWNLPLSMEVIPFGMHKNSFTAQQVKALLNDSNLPLSKQLVVNTLDSNYLSPEYIVDTYDQENLIISTVSVVIVMYGQD